MMVVECIHKGESDGGFWVMLCCLNFDVNRLVIKQKHTILLKINFCGM